MVQIVIYSVQQIKFEMIAHIKEFGASFSEWYVGIASDPKQSLFEKHGVDKKSDIWIYKQALTFNACQTVQRYFLQILGTDGELINTAEENMDCVYLYKKSERTTP